MIDTRAAGGYVVGPGSTTPDGVYRFTDDRAPANLPAWLVQALTPKPRTAISAPVVVRSERLPAYIDAALRGERDRVAATQPGTHNKTLFVAAVALGRHVGEDHLPSTTAQALTNAVHARRPRPEPGVIFHSDSEYVGAGDLDVRLPVGREGQCWDNAVAESFFATIKTELLDRHPWPTKAMAHKAIFEYVETSHQPSVSSRTGLIVRRSWWTERRGGVAGLVGDQAVVQRAQHAVEQLAQCGDVVVTRVAAGPVAGLPVRVVPDRGERPNVAGRSDAVVLGAPGVHEAGLAGGTSDRGDAGESLESSRVGEPAAVVADLGQQPGTESDPEPGNAGHDLRVGVGVEGGVDLFLQLGDRLAPAHAGAHPWPAR
jgi:hypothetical protein